MKLAGTPDEEDLTAIGRVSGHGLARLLGNWQQGGTAYVALADGLRRALMSGSLPLRTQVPSERELAAALNVSRTTTTAAYQRLRDEGLLVSRRGSGSITTLPATRHRHAAATGRTAEQTEGTIDLTMAAPGAPAQLHQAYTAALNRMPEYLTARGYEPTGLPLLRAAVAERFTERGTPTTADQILITTGAQHAIHLVMEAMVGPGDRVAVEHPTYPNAIETIRSRAARPVPVPITDHGLDIDLLESTIKQVSPRLVYLVPDFHNPTGRCLDAEARERVRYLARRYRTTVIGDETLTDLALDGPPPPPLATAGTGSSVITVGSASKSFWGGLRVGWIRAHPDLIERLAVARSVSDVGTAVLEQLAVYELMDYREEILAERTARVRASRDALIELLWEHLPSWHGYTPAGGLSLWADLGAPVSTAMAALALNHGVRMTPGPAFGVDGSFENFIRLTFTASPEVLADAVGRLATVWHSLGRSPGAQERSRLPVM